MAKIILTLQKKRQLWQHTKIKIKRFLSLQQEISNNLDLIRGNSQQIEAHQRNAEEWKQVEAMIDQFLKMQELN